MKRRNFLLAAPVACIPAVGQGTVTVNFDSETPVATLFREWKRATDAANDPALSDDEVDRLCASRSALEAQLNSTRAQNVDDVLMKICAATDFGFYSRDDTCFETGWDEAIRRFGC